MTIFSMIIKIKHIRIWWISLCFLVLNLGAEEIDKIDPSKKNDEVAKVMVTPQGELIRELFSESEKIHLIALEVSDESSFINYQKKLSEIESKLHSILLKLENINPLSQAEQIELRSLLKKEEEKISQIEEQASKHIVGLKDVLLGQKLKEEQTNFVERISPALIKQSLRHYKLNPQANE